MVDQLRHLYQERSIREKGTVLRNLSRKIEPTDVSAFNEPEQSLWDKIVITRLTDARWGADSNNVPNDFNIEHAYYIYVIDPIFMNGYSSDIFNTKSTYVGSNPHTMQIPYNPRNLPSSGTPVANVTAVYHDCHCDNDDSELTCTMCGYFINTLVP
ncbi:hypothetical protein GLOIN_2v1684053 [Rhizophagus irregularis DAOM 181602=DAOM 197198]|nr:hypothetical protein GLOIN_2v1684053 [Rhizophagus irregularis DAOM 181602=DAOM 197198]